MKHIEDDQPALAGDSTIDSEVNLGLIVDQLSTAVWIFDIDNGQVTWANDAALEVWAAGSRDELFARDMKSGMSPAVARRLRQYQSDFIERNATFTEMWTLYPNGAPRPMRVRFSGVRLPDGRMGMLCDGTEDTSMKPEALRSADALLHTQLMISLHRDDGSTLYLNPAARAHFSKAHASLEDRFVRHSDYDRLVKEVRTNGETSLIARVRTSSGVKWHELTARSCLDPVSGEPSMLISESDVSELKEAEALAQNMARQDPLTRLPNRLALPTLFENLRNRANSVGARLGVFFIDLDQFKAINDTLGHREGDKLLMDVSQRLSGLCGKREAVVRLGSDEFLFLAKESVGGRTLDDLAHEISVLLSIVLNKGGRRFTVTPSIGLARYPEHGNNIETLMQNADLAMYKAKLAGRNRVCIFEDHMREDMERQAGLLADIHDAFEKGQFEAYYQPRYCPKTKRINAVEALARWNHPQRGLISPADFIPLCEKTGMIDRLGMLILDQALRQQRKWRDIGREINVSVNVSLRQLSDPGFGLAVAKALATHAGIGSMLELELTETMLSEGSDVVQKNLDDVRLLGVRIAIDDFGIGYSNLARLSGMAVDCIKIDRSLIQSLPENKELVQMVIALCKLIKAKIVAEGVETARVANWASKNGCHELQGYLYGKPMPAAALENLLLGVSETSEQMASR